jgi:arylsulfatase A-like enzyme
MYNHPLTRRDFLKLSSLVPLLYLTGRSTLRTGQFENNDKLPNILILVFDAFSAKHLPLYGYGRKTTPNLAKLVRKATVFHQHYAGGNFTIPGTASLLTGTYPWSHRAFNMYGTVAKPFEERNLFSAINDRYYKIAYTHNLQATVLLHQFRRQLNKLERIDRLTVAGGIVSEHLFPNDYTVGLWSESILRGINIPLSSSLLLSVLDKKLAFDGIEKTLENYSARYPRGLPNNDTGHFFILERAVDWIIDQVSSAPRPYLGYFHLWPPHDPYSARQDFVGMFDDGWIPPAKPRHHFSKGHSDELLGELRRYYDEYIAYIDSEFTRLYNHLKEKGSLSNTYLVLTSDHGEMFERGIDNHLTPVLYEPIIRIPLIIFKPGQEEREDIYLPTSAVDLLPTLMHITGGSRPEWCEGQLLPSFGGPEGNAERSVFAIEAKENSKYGPLRKATFALIRGRYKLIHYVGYENYHDQYELYDLENDPEELENLHPFSKSTFSDLRLELEEKLNGIGQSH